MERKMLTTNIRLPKLMMIGVMIMTLIALLLNPFVNAAEASSHSSKEVTQVAKKLIGVKYKAGGKDAKGFDASGFTQYVFEKSIKMKLARTSKDQYKMGKSIQKKDIKEGDLLFFNTSGKGISFVGIALGKDKFIAVSVSKGVSEQSLNTKYWKDRYVGAKRVLK